MESVKTLDFGHELSLEKLCNLEAEARILGAVLLCGDSQSGTDLGPELVQSLECDAFVDPRHRAIYRAIAICAQDHRRPDLTTVASVLADNRELQAAGGNHYLMQLSLEVVHVAPFSEWLAIVSAHYTRRNLVEASYSIARAAHQTQESLDNVAERCQKALESAFTNYSGTQLSVNAEDALQGLLGTIERRMTNEVPVLKSELYDLDKLLGGWRNPASTEGGRLIVVGARPAMGKTSLALQLAIRLIARAPIGGLFFSLEMTAEELWLRMVSSAVRIDSSRIAAGQLSDQELQLIRQTTDRFRHVPLSVYDRSGISLNSIASECRAAQQRLAKEGRRLGVVVVDYFQLIETTGDRQQSLAAFSRGLKRLSRELGCDVIVVSQLNRECETRRNKRPLMSDLRETGQLEQDANVIIGLYRDEVYNPETVDRGICEAIVLKNRGGPIGTAKLLYEPEFTQFKNLASSAPQMRGAA